MKVDFARTSLYGMGRANLIWYNQDRCSLFENSIDMGLLKQSLFERKIYGVVKKKT